MNLVDLLTKETGVHPENILILRHSNTDLKHLERYGGNIEEYTIVQPIGTKYDFLKEHKPPVRILAVIAFDKLYAVYEIQGVDKEGTVHSLISQGNLLFEKSTKRPDLPGRRFQVRSVNSSALGKRVSGWTNPRVAVARFGSRFFDSVEVSGTSLRPNNSLKADPRADPEVLPQEITEPEKAFEGAKKSVTVNIYERDPNARRKCIAHWGVACVVCGFNFSTVYGELGEGFIHVHHLVPLSEIGERYELDPVTDLRPVCPNCHAMIHRTSPAMTIKGLQAVIRSGTSDDRDLTAASSGHGARR